MKPGIKNPLYHVLFWIVVVLVLILIFGKSWGNSLHALYFTVSLLPIILGTFYFFNYFLVPRFFLKRRYFKFGLYAFYMLVVSLYLEMMVLTWSFIYLAEFNMQKIGPNASDTVILGVIMYLIVFLGSFVVVATQLEDKRKELEHLKEEQEKQQRGFLEIMSQRKITRIPYDDILFIESLSDYIKVNLENGEEVVSKETISSLSKRLPEGFLRIHRAFLINTSKLSGFSHNEVNIGNVTLNIGRSYKASAMAKLKPGDA